MRSVCLGTSYVCLCQIDILVSWIENKLAEFSIDPVRVVGFVHDSRLNITLSRQLFNV